MVQEEGDIVIKVGDVLATREQMQEGITWCDANMDSGPGPTFTSAMRKLGNPLAKWSAGTEYKGLHRGAHWPEIRAHLGAALNEADTELAVGAEWLRRLSQRHQTFVLRSAATRRAVLIRSGGRCENPRCTTPGGRVADVKANGDPILEVDHIINLGGEGEDIASNMIALCPNCHAMKTYGTTAETLRQEFAIIVARYAA
jgi:5-methylcytosine-specific restriction endonuclease McrA